MSSRRYTKYYLVLFVGNARIILIGYKNYMKNLENDTFTVLKIPGWTSLCILLSGGCFAVRTSAAQPGVGKWCPRCGCDCTTALIRTGDCTYTLHQRGLNKPNFFIYDSYGTSAWTTWCYLITTAYNNALLSRWRSLDVLHKIPAILSQFSY